MFILFSGASNAMLSVMNMQDCSIIKEKSLARIEAGV
jgi:hypothetical protein